MKVKYFCNKISSFKYVLLYVLAKFTNSSTRSILQLKYIDEEVKAINVSKLSIFVL